MALERCAEGTCRAVADTLRDLDEGYVPLAEEILGERHAPREQVFRWRYPHGAREAVEERRARKRSGPRELGHGPWACDVVVYLPYRRRQSRIG